MAPGDMDSPDELQAAFRGAYGVFSVQNFWLPEVGAEGEVRQGKNVAEAAAGLLPGEALGLFLSRLCA